MQQRYEGPLPPASEMERYEQIAPGAADRILTMAEHAQEKFFALEDKEAQRRYNMALITNGLAFLTILLICALLLFAIHKQSTLAAIAACVTSIATVAGIFLYGRRTEK